MNRRGKLDAMVSFRVGKFFVRARYRTRHFFLFSTAHTISLRMQFFASLYATEQLWMDFCYVAAPIRCTGRPHPLAIALVTTSVIGSKSITSKRESWKKFENFCSPPPSTHVKTWEGSFLHWFPSNFVVYFFVLEISFFFLSENLKNFLKYEQYKVKLFYSITYHNMFTIIVEGSLCAEHISLPLSLYNM